MMNAASDKDVSAVIVFEPMTIHPVLPADVLQDSIFELVVK
jgi:hypothetical protein